MLALYADEIGEVKEREGYTLVDVVALDPAQSDYDELKTPFREKFLSEHAHDDDEDRYFAKGAGVFYLHANEKVHAVYCEAGDLISVPANTTHWFDMGTSPTTSACASSTTTTAGSATSPAAPSRNRSPRSTSSRSVARSSSDEPGTPVLAGIRDAARRAFRVPPRRTAACTTSVMRTSSAASRPDRCARARRRPVSAGAATEPPTRWAAV